MLDSAIAALMFLLRHLLLLAALAATAYVLGRRLSRRIPYRDPIEAVAFSTTLGLGAFAWLLFLSGLAGGLQRGVIVALVLAVHVLGWREWRRIAATVRRWRRRTRASPLWLAALAPAAVLPLYPPTAHDATVYHLPFAAGFLREHGPVFLPTLRFPVFPVLEEMLFTATMAFGGDTAAQLVPFLQMLLTALLALAWGRRLLCRRAGTWAAALWLGTPLVAWMGGAAYVDLGLALFATAALLAWEIGRETDEPAWVWMAGAAAGFAAGSKYLGLFFVAALGLSALLEGLRRRHPRRLLAFALAAALTLAPWYLWIVHHTGNPVFPYYAHLFGDSEWLSRIDRGRDIPLGSAPGTAWLPLLQEESRKVAGGVVDLLRVPWDALFRRHLYDYRAPLSPFLLLLLPTAGLAALLAPRTRRPLLWTLAYGLAWLVTTRDLRFLLAVLPALAVALAGGLDRLAARLPRGAATLLATTLLLLPGPLYAVYKISQRGAPPVTQQQRRSYLHRQLPGYSAIDFLNRERGDGYVVYALFAPTLRYYAEGRFLGDLLGPYRYGRLLPILDDGEKLHRRLRAFGADHLLVRRGVPRVRYPRGEAFRRLFVPLFDQGGFTVYRLAPAEDGAEERIIPTIRSTTSSGVSSEVSIPW